MATGNEGSGDNWLSRAIGAVKEQGDPMKDEPFVLNIVHNHNYFHAPREDRSMGMLETMMLMKAIQTHQIESNREEPLQLSDGEVKTPTNESSLTGVTYEIIDTSHDDDLGIRVIPLAYKEARDELKNHFELIELPFAKDWKKTVHKRETNVNFLGVKLMVDGGDRNYLSLYSAKPILTKVMYNPDKYETCRIRSDFNPHYFYTILCAMTQFNQMKRFHYVEEYHLTKADEGRMILSNDFPKTDIWEFNSIYHSKPESVWTNFRRNIFEVVPHIPEDKNILEFNICMK